MKITKCLLTTIYLCIGIFLFFSCAKKAEDPKGQNDTEVGKMTVKIDGVQYDLIGVASKLPDTSFIWAEESLVIAGGSPSGTIYSMGIFLFIPKTAQITEGTYNECNSNSIGAEICGTMILSAPFTHGSINETGGQMDVTLSTIEYQKGGSCVGTFSGTLVNDTGSVSITEGKFNFKIVE